MIADRLAKFGRDRPLMFDSEVRNTAPCIDAVGRRKGVGRADILTSPARTASVLPRYVRLQFCGRVYRAQKKPAAMLLAHDIAVLALPADPRCFGQCLFHYRSGIDKDLYAYPCLMRQPARQSLQRAFYDIVIIATACINRHPSAVGMFSQRHRVIGGGIAHAEHDNRAHVGP